MQRIVRGTSRIGRAVQLVLAVGATIGFSTVARGEWIDLTPDRTEIRVLQDDGERIVVEYTLDGFERGSIEVQGLSHATYFIPEATAHMVAGAPQLPTIRRSVLLPDDRAMQVRILERETTTMATAPVAPSKGHLKRTVDPASVPFEFGPVYQAGVAYPAEAATLGEPYVLRDFRGGVLEINPLRYLPATQELEVTTRIMVEVVPSDGAVVNAIDRIEPPRFVDQEFAPIYAAHFLNYDEDYYTPIDEPGRCLVVSDQAVWDAAERLAQWKLQKGIPTMLVDVDDLNNDPWLVKAQVDTYFNEPEGLTFVVIVGDVQQVPTLYGEIENAPSDVQFSRIVGNDFYPDLFVSRLSVQNAASADYVIEKMIKYELDPFMDETAWFSKGTGIASSEGGWSGYTDCERVGLIRDMLLDYTYTEVDEICEPTATKAMIFSALNIGSTMVNYIGHGSGTSWGTTGFNVNDIHNLDNGWKNSFLVDVACTNGQYTMNESFSEAWVRAGSMAEPKSGIGTYGSSLVCSWIPPCIMQNEANRLLTEEITNTVGGICMGGIMRVLDTEGYDGQVLFEEYNILGDCTLPLRTTVPMPLDLVHAGTYYVDDPTYDVNVTGVENALVALYSEGVLYGSGYTDPTGFVSVEMDVLPAEPMNLTMTVTAYNHETRVVEVPVEWASLAEMILDDYALIDIGDGTVNGQMEAGESAEVWITLVNDGLEAASGVTAVLTPVTPGVTMTQNTAGFGTVEPGNTATSDVAYTFDLGPSVTDGSPISFQIDIDADAGQWDQVLLLTAHAPVLGVEWFHVDDASGDGDGRLDPGESVALLVQLRNSGTGDAAGVSGRLISGSLSIPVQPGASTLGDLPAGAEGALDPAFGVSAFANVDEGYYNFNTWITANNGVNQRIGFQVPIGGFYENVENGEGEWVHAAMEGADEWHLSTERNSTPLGSTAWKFGSSEGGDYAPDGDGVLLSPLLPLNGGSELRFRHWIDAEVGGIDMARDGGLVEISLSGGPWEPLVPAGGYAYELEAGTTLPAGTGVFSGSFGWEEVTVDLAGYTGNAQVRFRFVSNGDVGGEGWYIDDVSVLGLDVPSSVEWTAEGLEGLQLAPVAPNPVQGRVELAFRLPNSSSVDLGIYDANGRRISTVVRGAFDAGVHVVDWSADASLESGVYFARLATGTHVKTQRMVIVH